MRINFERRSTRAFLNPEKVTKSPISSHSAAEVANHQFPPGLGVCVVFEGLSRAPGSGEDVVEASLQRLGVPQWPISVLLGGDKIRWPQAIGPEGALRLKSVACGGGGLQIERGCGI